MRFFTPPRAAALLAFLLALAAADERTFGLVPDGQQMLSTAASLARFGEWGISRDFTGAFPRASGDAVTRYGLAQPAVELVPVLLARATGAPSAPFFVLTQAALLAGAAAAVAAAAALLGAAPLVAALLGAGLVAGTPLLAYAASDFGEPLQALAVALTLLFAIRCCSGKRTRGSEIGLGLAAGLALLSKPLLLAVVLPLVAAGAWERSRFRARPLLAFAAPAALAVALDVVRFGRPFGAYAGYRFDYPLLSGLWRLTVGPNKGLLFYAPLVLLGIPALARLRPRRLAFASAAGALFLLLAVSCWWAWDGEMGWGPRLLLPALPLLVVPIARLSGRGVRRAALALGGAGLAVNLLGALEPFPLVYALAALVPPEPISEARAEGTRLNLSRAPDGTLLAAGDRHLGLTPSWSPIRVHARLLAERLRGGDVGARLEGGALAGLTPPFVPALPKPDPSGALLEWAANPLVEPRHVVAAAVSPFRWPAWGRAVRAEGGEDPYDLALRDQAARALDTGRFARGEALARELLARGSDDPRDAALGAEAARRAGNLVAADGLRARSSACHPWLLFVDVARGRATPCLPPAEAAGLSASVTRALAEGKSLPQWWRALRGGPAS